MHNVYTQAKSVPIRSVRSDRDLTKAHNLGTPRGCKYQWDLRYRLHVYLKRRLAVVGVPSLALAFLRRCKSDEGLEVPQVVALEPLLWMKASATK